MQEDGIHRTAVGLSPGHLDVTRDEVKVEMEGEMKTSVHRQKTPEKKCKYPMLESNTHTVL